MYNLRMQKRPRQPKRPLGEARRTDYVAARISAKARHYLEILSLLQRESLSSVIERGIVELVGREVEWGGAAIHGEADEEGLFETTNVALDTWAPEEWLRRLKLSLIAPSLLIPKEVAFWRDICQKKSIYWKTSTPTDTSGGDQSRWGEKVLAIGVPYERAISEAWERFRERGADERSDELRTPAR
jgi:hypothetical protein